MSALVLTLPAGTDETVHFCLPKCGAWLGDMTIRFSTFGVDATIHEWLLIYPDHPDGKKRYRRTGGSSGNNFSDWTLPKDTRVGRGVYKGESLCRVNYTSTNDISMCVEMTRHLTPSNYPPIPASSGSANEIAIVGNPTAGKVYWL